MDIPSESLPAQNDNFFGSAKIGEQDVLPELLRKGPGEDAEEYIISTKQPA